MSHRSLNGSMEQASLFDLSAFSRPEKSQVGDWGWENSSDTPEPEIRRFEVGDRIQAKLPNSPEGIVVEIRQGKYAWSDRLLVEWDKNVPRKDKGHRGSVIASKAVLLEECYPTESSIEDGEPSGKTATEQRDEAIAQEYKDPDTSPLKLAQKYGISTKEVFDVLSDLFGDQLREVSELKWQEARGHNLPPTQEGEIPEEAKGDRTPAPSLFPIEEKYGPVESWPDSEDSGMFDFLSYPTETTINKEHPSGKTRLTVDEEDHTPSPDDCPIEASYPTELVIKESELTGKTRIGSGEVDRSHPEEITDQWGFWINTASDWGEFYWRGNQPTIETSAQECVILEDRGDRWLVVPVGKRPISLEGDGFATGCVKPYEIYKSTLSPDPPASLSYPAEMINRHEDLTGKTIRQQILPLSISEKRSLLVWLQETIKDEEWTPPPVKSGRQVVGEPVKTSKGYRRQELVRCGKSTCKSCPHGPYWYEYWSEGGKRRSKYVGKNP